MQTFLQDLVYAARALRKDTGFTIAALFSLALGIGANAAVFRLVDSLLLRPIRGVEDPDRLVGVFQTMEKFTNRYSSISYADYADVRDTAQVFSGLAAYRPGRAVVLNHTGDDGERVWAELVSGNYFPVLGVRAVRGRTIAAGDEEPVAVLSHRLWKARFAADPAVLGKTIRLNRHEFVVIGIASEEFRGVRLDGPADLWVPIGMHARLDPASAHYFPSRGSRWFQVIGRLKPGITSTQASAALGPLAMRLAQTYTENRERGFAVVPANTTQLAIKARGATLVYFGVLMSAVGMVLLIGCANVANLLLARGAARRRELGIRVAIGAAPGRIVRQILTESVLLALAAGALGLVAARVAGSLIGNFALPMTRQFTLEAAFDWRIFLFTLAASLITGFVFGIVPAMEAAKVDPAQFLNKSSVGQRGRRGGRLRNTFAIAQVAVCVLLLIGAGLFLQAFRAAWTSMAARDPDRLLLVTVDLAHANYDDSRGEIVQRQALDRLAAVPGVRRAALAEAFPGGLNETSALAENSAGQPGSIQYNVIGNGYFEIAGATMLRGRYFEGGDTHNSPSVLIVNEAAALRFWPGQDPLGRRIRLGAAAKPFSEVVGIVRDENPDACAYLSAAQKYQPKMIVHLRVADSGSALPAIRRLLRESGEDMGASEVQPLSQIIADLLVVERTAASLTGTFGFLALVLATLGIYSLLSYLTGQRVHEMGIRMALGATRCSVIGLVLRHGVALTATGVAIGLAASVGCTRVLASFLHGVSPTDPATFAGVSALLLAIGAGAAIVPAWRTTRADPLTALRHE